MYSPHGIACAVHQREPAVGHLNCHCPAMVKSYDCDNKETLKFMSLCLFLASEQFLFQT